MPKELGLGGTGAEYVIDGTGANRVAPIRLLMIRLPRTDPRLAVGCQIQGIYEAQHGCGREVEIGAGLSPAPGASMAPRKKSVPTRRLPSTHLPRESPARLPASRPADRATRRWRRVARLKAVSAVVSATKTLGWTRPLIEALLEELYVDDHFEELLGGAPGDLRPGQYPQAIAVALILRHSWHPDDFVCMLKRLKLRIDDPSCPTLRGETV